jgi:hypothetical protein
MGAMVLQLKSNDVPDPQGVDVFVMVGVDVAVGRVPVGVGVKVGV